MRRDTRDASIQRLTVLLLLVAAGGVLLGGATSFAQTFLPDALQPFANSASGWTLLTALMVAACRARTLPFAVYGAVSFVMLVLGYQVVSGLRGFPTSETLFLIAGILVGPFVGIAASWLNRDGWRAMIGCGVLAGIAIGEGVYGLTLVADTTGYLYWTVICVVGVGMLFTTAVRRLHSWPARLTATALVALVGAAFYFTYIWAGQLGA
ncbi:MAG: hypothetical protein JWQ43_2546 [Glaciihabitans sp.]|nr:hypothetical protein [Glaciihabitans sp.]